MRKRKKNLLERMSLDELGKTEQVAIYLHNHPECLTERLMTHVAARLMNYGYIRLRIKQMYRQIESKIQPYPKGTSTAVKMADAQMLGIYEEQTQLTLMDILT